MSSIHSRNSSQALARSFSQLAITQGRTHRSSSRYSKLRAFKGGLGVKVDKHGRMSGKVRPAADGKVSLPGGLTLQAPPKGGLSTHQLAPNKLLVLTTDSRGLVSLKTKDLGVALDAKKATLRGSALPTEVNGRKVVDLPVLGQLPVPQQGLTDSYMLSPEKLLTLKHEADGTVTVNTKTLGLEADKKGNFKGYMLPDANGKVEIAGKEIDVSGLKPGKTTTKTIKIKGKKFKVKLRMNEDGTVTVQGKRKKGFFKKLLGGIGKVLNTIGKFAPFLAAIPGLGWASLVAKGVGLFNAAKGVVDGIKSGNWLAVATSAAGFIGGAFKGVVSTIANKVADVGGFVQTAWNTFKHGLGKGLLQVVANGANLFASGARALGAGRLATDASKVAGYAGALDAAGRGDLLPGAAMLANSWGADLLREQQRQQQQPALGFHPSIRFNTNPTLADFGGPEALARYDELMRNGFSVPGGGSGGGGGGAGTKSLEGSSRGVKGQGKGLVDQLRGKVTPEQLAQVQATIDTIKNAVDYTAAARAPFAEVFDQLVKQGEPGLRRALALIPRLQSQRTSVGVALMVEATRLERMATRYPQGSAPRNALLAEARKVKAVRVEKLQQFDSKLGQLNSLVSKNQKLGEIANHLGQMGKFLDVMGAMGAAYEGYQDSSATTQLGKALDAVFEGGANYGVGALAGTHPMVAVFAALDGATGNNVFNGPVRNLVRTAMGMARAYTTGDWTHLEKLVEDNRNGTNGKVIQGYTLVGDQLNNLINLIQDQTDRMMSR